MKLGLSVYSTEARINIDLDLLRHVESLGYDSVWVAENYGSDVVSQAAWIFAHTTKLKVGTSTMPMPGRTPATTAMSAMSLQQLSGGRFILGLGASVPQFVEGWHGLPYGKPLTRTREYIGILRKIFEGKEPLTHEGEHYTDPVQGREGDGPG